MLPGDTMRGSVMIPDIPKSAKRATPSSVIRMFPWTGVNVHRASLPIDTSSYRINTTVDDVR